MKLILPILFIFFIVQRALGQVTDNFSDGDFTTSPAWAGDQAKFAINTGRLRLMAPAVAETAFLSTASQSINNASWEFYAQMDFNPSSTNFAKVYLVSDQNDLSGLLNGYFVKIGNTSDEISLYRQNGSSETEIIDGLDGRLNFSSVQMKIKVIRDDIGNWELLSDVGLTGTFVLESMVTDPIHAASAHFGVHCTYTSTRSDQFWFDDFVVTGDPYIDIDPPFVIQAYALNESVVQVIFSEIIDPASATSTTNYFINKNIGVPFPVNLLADGKSVELQVAPSFVNGEIYDLTVTGITDPVGNTLAMQTVSFQFFQAVAAINKDVIITEVFADPSPAIALPAVEFLELFNRSNNPFDLDGWTVSDGTSNAELPPQIILPNEYWIITSASSAGLFNGYGQVLGASNFPTLNNDGDWVILKDPAGTTIDSIHYLPSWYRNEDKSQGGWSLELIDPQNPCGEEDNWTAAENSNGGTPGTQNSVFANKPDLTGPFIAGAIPIQPDLLLVNFNEKIDKAGLAGAQIVITPIVPFTVPAFTDLSLRNIHIQLLAPLAPKQLYTITIDNLTDCAGNLIQNDYHSAEFALPELPDSLDVIVNEILFNPRSGGVDFVEIYNRSEKFFNIKNWMLSNFENNLSVNEEIITVNDYLFKPGAYIALTSDAITLYSQYPGGSDSAFFTATLPSFPDDEGSVAILDNQGTVLDVFNYEDDFHSVLIDDDEGVSLERISVTAASNEKSNWKSASSAQGHATPGFLNSNSRPENFIAESAIKIVPEIFSLQSAGNDFATIQYHFDQSGFVAKVIIFDWQGHLIKTVVENELLGFEGFFRWDGDREDGSRARSGYYTVWFEVFDNTGTVKTFTKRVVIASN